MRGSGKEEVWHEACLGGVLSAISVNPPKEMAQNELGMVFMKSLVFKKLLFFSLSVLACQFSGFARSSLDLGRPASATPYDRYMSPVRHVLNNLNSEDASMDRARQLMHEGRSFRYSFTTPYLAATPGVTASTHAGDCKAKALWLADQLNDESVRFVIGKAHRTSQMSHAWLLWQHDNRWFILDCTNNWDPIPADSVSSNQYIPYYSFAKNGEYRHRATEQLTAQTASVAGSRGAIAQR